MSSPSPPTDEPRHQSDRTPPASELVRSEWYRRVEAEYRSAALSQHFTLWLIQIGAPPDLISDGLRIVSDELIHAELSYLVYKEADGTEMPALDRETLSLVRVPQAVLEWDVLRCGVEIYCLGETVAVPLFSKMRDTATVPTARVALDRILVDEVRHRDFGWNVLDWMLQTPLADRVAPTVEAQLPEMFAALKRNYGSGGAPTITKDDRAWGLASGADYSSILARTFERDYGPRFAERGINAAPAWLADLAANNASEANEPH